MDNDIINNHPSYAIAQFSRMSSSGVHPLFGSSVGHSNTIRLSISRAKHIRSEDFSCDRYHELNELIEVEMSSSQFAELITTMNYGSGVPVTLKHLNGERPEEPPVENKRQQHSEEFRQKMVKFTKTLEEGQEKLQTLLKKTKLSKDDKHEMKHLFEFLSVNIKSNIPFFERQFEEQMDKSVAEAKGEIESFITNAVTQTGLEGLRDEGKMLGMRNKEGDE